MSGICGLLGLRGQPPDDTVLAAMAEAMHYGSGGARTAINGPCGLGFAWQGPPDLGSAVQPLRASHAMLRLPDAVHTEVWGVHSGRIYNYLEIRKALEATGHRFATDTDTETLLRSYLQFGPTNFIKAFRGMFSLAIWDLQHQRLLLLRDRLGLRPLYYALSEDWLVFGSEIRALLACPAVPRRLNEAFVPHYLAYGYPPSPETLFEGIRAVPPGYMLTVELGGTRPTFQLDAYWYPPYPFSGPDPRGEDNICNDLLAHLRWAVRLRMDKDKPMGAFLSGGLDSAAVVALMAQESSRTIQTFSFGFEGRYSFEDTRYARQIAARFVTDHHELVIEPELETLLSELILAYDQPFGNAAAIPVYLISREARQHVPVVLTGDGGDELFAGYPHFRTARLARSYNQLPDVAQRAVEGLLDRLPEAVAFGGFMQQANHIVRAAHLPLAERYLSWVRCVPDVWLTALMGGQREQAVQEHYRSLFTVPQGGEEPDVIAQLLDVNLRTYLPGDLLTRLDRCGAAAALEVRLPFLDHQFLHFVATIPSSLKLRRGTPKYVLRQALRGVLPDAVIDRKQRSPEVPVDEWFRGQLMGYARSVLLGKQAAQRGLFDMEAVRAMLDAHLAEQADLGYALWALLTFELWMQLYLD